MLFAVACVLVLDVLFPPVGLTDSYVHSLKWYITIENADSDTTAVCSEVPPADCVAAGNATPLLLLSRHMLCHHRWSSPVGFLILCEHGLLMKRRFDAGAVLLVAAAEAIHHSLDGSGGTVCAFRESVLN